MEPALALKIINSGKTPQITNWIPLGDTDTLPIRLYTSFFIHPIKSRQEEYESCILGNSFLEQHIFVETDEAENWIRTNAPKAVIYRTTTTPVFQNFFDAGENSYINIVANADILFNETIFRTQCALLDKVVLCLGKWDVIEKDVIIPYTYVGSQDVWIWKGILVVPRVFNFKMGIPGCDNRIAAELNAAGYKIANVMADIVAIHKHATEIRSSPKEAVSPPYAAVVPTFLTVSIPRSVNLYSVPFRYVDTILHVGYPMTQLQDEFKKYCRNYIFLHRDSPNLNSKVIAAFSNNTPNIVFCQLQAAGILGIEVIKTMRQNKTYMINWTGDARRPIPSWYKEYAPFFDITLFSNETDVQEMRSLGFRSAFWNIGFETKLYDPLAPAYLNHDIVFMGNNYPEAFPLSSLRSDMVNKLKTEFGSSFHVFGNGWGTTCTNEQQESCIYRGSKIAISLSHYDLERYFSDRMLRIMGCSTLCLTKWYPGIEKDFTDGVDVVVWRDIPDLIAKIHYYLKNPKERFIIARGGFLRVTLEHTWSIRMGQLQYVIDEYPQRIPVPKKFKLIKFLRS
jgi:hypothetical protein